MKKIWFVPIKYIVPEDLEYFLEEKAAEGLQLKPVGQLSLFYYEFDEVKPHKAKFLVDKTSMDKAEYVKIMMDRGWEYIGNSGNCIIWRQEYQDKRPEDCSDKYYKDKHTRNMGIIMLIVALLFILSAFGFVGGFIYERKMNAEYLHYGYFFQAAIHLPIGIYCAIKAKKCLLRK